LPYRRSGPARPWTGTPRVIAVVLGTLPAALLLGATLALILPLPMSSGVHVGSFALIPIWSLVAYCALIADSARDAWLSLICLTVLAALLSGSVLVLEHVLTHGAAYWSHG